MTEGGAKLVEEGDDDSVGSHNEERGAGTSVLKFASWTDHHGLTEQALKMNSISVGTLPASDGADGFSDNVANRSTNDMRVSFSDEKDGDDERLIHEVLSGEETLGEAGDGDNDLPLDSFSMLYVAKSPVEHGLPLLVFGLQMIILVLLMIDLLQTSDRPLATTMNVPVDVPLTVKISQYIACVVSVLTADDLVSGTLYVGRRVVSKDHMNAERERLMAAEENFRKSEQRRHLLRSVSEAEQLLKNAHWKWELAK